MEIFLFLINYQLFKACTTFPNSSRQYNRSRYIYEGNTFIKFYIAFCIMIFVNPQEELKPGPMASHSLHFCLLSSTPTPDCRLFNVKLQSVRWQASSSAAHATSSSSDEGEDPSRRWTAMVSVSMLTVADLRRYLYYDDCAKSHFYFAGDLNQ